jgi:hypothetical protein
MPCGRPARRGHERAVLDVSVRLGLSGGRLIAVCDAHNMCRDVATYRAMTPGTAIKDDPAGMLGQAT